MLGFGTSEEYRFPLYHQGDERSSAGFLKVVRVHKYKTA
jgi:hypothetical protein